MLDDYLIYCIKKYPYTTFHIIILPNPLLYYKDYKDDIYMFKNLSLELLKYKNVKLYFFGNEEFVANMNNYLGDKQHYKKHINSRINKAINEGTNIISIDNMEDEFNKFIKKVENYDIKAYKEALKLDIRE